MENRLLLATLVFFVLLVSEVILIDAGHAKENPKTNMTKTTKIDDDEKEDFPDPAKITKVKKIEEPDVPGADGKPKDAKKMEEFPGTKWCGTKHNAYNGDDLGDFYELDICCREHTKCPLAIRSGKKLWGLTNDKDYTVRDCLCSRSFRMCLRTVEASSQNWAESSLATVVGKVYFKALDLPCIAFKKRPDTKAKIETGHEGATFVKQLKWKSRKMTKERKEIIKTTFGAKPMYPGTSWCGLGNVDYRDKDFGYYDKVDKCCRDRNTWILFIPANMHKWGVDNDGRNTIFECSGDHEFHRCLKKVTTYSTYFIQRYVADSFGALFFDILATPCVSLPGYGNLLEEPVPIDSKKKKRKSPLDGHFEDAIPWTTKY